MRITLFVMFILLIGITSSAFTNPSVTYSSPTNPITGRIDGTLTANLPISLNPTYTESDGVNDGQICTGGNVFVSPNTGTEWIFQGGFVGTPPIVVDANRFNSLVNLRDGAGRPWCFPQSGGVFPFPCEVRQQFAGTFSADAAYCHYLSANGRLPSACSFSGTSCTCSAFATVLGQGTVSISNNGALIQTQPLPGSGVSVSMNTPGSNTIQTTLQLTTFGYITGAIGVILSNPQFPVSLTESRTFNVINPPNGPNLVSVAASVSPTVVTSGQQVNVQVTLANVGDMDALVAFPIIFSTPGGFSGSLAPADGSTVFPRGTQKVFIGTLTAPPVNAQTTFALSTTVGYRSLDPNPCTGQFIVPAQLTVGIANIVVNPPTFPDLTGSIAFSTSSPAVGQTIAVVVTTSNIGNAQAASSITSITGLGINPVVTTAPILAPGQSFQATFAFTCPGPGIFVFSATEDSTGIVPESNENNNVQFASVTCSLQALPDLTIPGQLIIPSPIRPGAAAWFVGDQVNFTARVRNIGSAGAGSSITTLITDQGTRNQTIGPLQPGQEINSTFTFYICPSLGSHTVTGIADSQNQVVESNEGNNVGSITISCVNPPDLISTITFSNNIPNVGDTVTVTVTTTNIGAGTTFLGSVTRITSPNATQNVNINALQPGGSQAFTFQFTCTQQGTFTFSSIADVNGQVPESNENNNQQTVTLNCGQGGQNLPDLVGTITFSNPFPQVGQTVTVTVTTSNIGNAQAGASVTRITSPQGTQNVNIGALNSSNSQIFSFNFTCTTAGSFTFTVTVDANGQVTESNENNNLQTVTLVCGGGVNLPDLIVQSITFNPSAPVAGVQTNVTYRILNNGSSATQNSFLSNLSLDGFVVDEKGIIGLAPGASQDLVFEWPAINVTQGLHRFCALADSKTNVPESNETNNLLCVDVFVAGGGEVCSILASTNPNSLFANITINYAGLGTITPDWSNITVDCGSPGVGFVNFPPCVGNGTGSCYARCGPYSISPDGNTFKITATILGRIFCSVQTACIVKV